MLSAEKSRGWLAGVAGSFKCGSKLCIRAPLAISHTQCVLTYSDVTVGGWASRQIAFGAAKQPKACDTLRSHGCGHYHRPGRRRSGPEPIPGRLQPVESDSCRDDMHYGVHGLDVPSHRRIPQSTLQSVQSCVLQTAKASYGLGGLLLERLGHHVICGAAAGVAELVSHLLVGEAGRLQAAKARSRCRPFTRGSSARTAVIRQ
jgi:hypothetical protein